MKPTDWITLVRNLLILVIVGCVGLYGFHLVNKFKNENKVLKEVITRLEADSRVAEVLVTGVNFNEEEQKTFTTIKFLEYGVDGKALKPEYFTFSGNIIQFQSLVIRFDNIHIRQADRLKGKSAYLFWKVFMLDGPDTQEFEITEMNAVPEGYKVQGMHDSFEHDLWREFWSFALDPQKASEVGIKNAQIEAPGSVFVPGILYTIKIEHDGGLRIDTTKLSPILRGEKIPE